MVDDVSTQISVRFRGTGFSLHHAIPISRDRLEIRSRSASFFNSVKKNHPC